MRCTLDDPNELWPALRALRARLRAAPTPSRVHLAQRGRIWSFTEDVPERADLVVAIEPEPADPRHRPWRVLPPFAAPSPLSGEPDPAHLSPFLQLYLPVVLAEHRARRAGSVHVTGHLAQTLDGRIACTSGHSQWIGNADNLRHAHRLRALHDAILVGRRTVERDDPQLTVRHVEGDDPRRVLLNGSASTWPLRRSLKIYAGTGCILVCRRNLAPKQPAVARIEVLPLDGDAAGMVSVPELLQALASRGLHSLFIEGGGQTLSGFLAAGRVDLLHLHVAPIILGSGVPAFVLPEVARLSHARRLRAEHFDLGGELLLVCRPDGVQEQVAVRIEDDVESKPA